jgi:hypothetical protein
MSETPHNPPLTLVLTLPLADMARLRDQIGFSNLSLENPAWMLRQKIEELLKNSRNNA